MGASTAWAQQPAPPEAKAPLSASDPVLDAAAQWIGRALYARCLCTAGTFSLSAAGDLSAEQKSHPVDWTLAGVDLQRVARKGDALEFSGVRVAAKFADDRKEFDRRLLKTETLKVTLPAPATPAAVDATMRRAFSIGIDRELQLAMPTYWRHYFSPVEPWTGSDLLAGQTIAIVGTSESGAQLAPPAVVHKASASFPEEAARDHIAGSVALQVVVDTTGHPHRIRIVAPLGYGLDAAAAEALSKTTFAPAAGGQSAAVQMVVKESFTLEKPQ
ncbi:energy transducer TonB [Granulicella cerasi]|uniref:Energy transducer TonB n=1 Tax=Granulicella cerasi TaxID=741063 RepID=A0ABW1Z8J4_9BACT|nr:energy transducer TonB [Granulicella cerasi]